MQRVARGRGELTVDIVDLIEWHVAQSRPAYEGSPEPAFPLDILAWN